MSDRTLHVKMEAEQTAIKWPVPLVGALFVLMFLSASLLGQPPLPLPPLLPPDLAAFLFKMGNDSTVADVSFSQGGFFFLYSPLSLWKPEVSTKMLIATNRQRLSVTFSHGRSIWLRFWMDKVLRKDAEGKCMYTFKKCCRVSLRSLCK